MDRDGTPNTPLLQHCARRGGVKMVVLLHETAVVRLPSSWMSTSMIVGHVMLSGCSIVEASLRVARLLRGEAI